MVTRLKSKAGRSLGLAVAAFLVFTLLASGSVLAQERHDAVQDTSFKDKFMAEAHALAAEIGAEFGLGADDAASLVETLLFTGIDAGPGVNMRWLVADLSASYGLEPRELIGFLQVYGQELMALGQGFGLMPERASGPAFGPRSAEFARRGPVGPASRWQADRDTGQYGPRGMHDMQPERGPYAVGINKARAEAVRYRFQRMHEEFHMQDAGHRYGGNHGRRDMGTGNVMMTDKEHAWQGGPETWDRFRREGAAAKGAWADKAEAGYRYDRQGGSEAWSRYGDIDAAKARWHEGKASDSIRFKRGGVEEWDRFDKDGSMPEGTWHDGDGSARKSGKPAAEAWDRFDKRAFASRTAWHGTETPDRMRAERARFGEHAGGRLRGGQPDFMDEDGMDVSVEAMVDDFEPGMMDLEHNVAAMVPVVLDVVGSTIVESLAESTGVPEAEMEAMVVQALLEGLDAAMDEGLVSQAEAMDLLMLLTGAGALER